jgi:hypothetical protein
LTEILVNSTATLQEYQRCQNLLSVPKGLRSFLQVLLALGACALAFSVVATWGLPASGAGAVALVSFFIYVFVLAQLTNARLRSAYRRVMEAGLTYAFTDETIRWTMQGGRAEVAWNWLDRIVCEPDLFVFARGYWYLCVPRRDVPPERLADFQNLIVRHEPQPAA